MLFVLDNIMNTNEVQHYDIGFTAGAAMLNETVAIANVYVANNFDWVRTKEVSFRENIMAKNKKSSNERYFTLMKQRIDALNRNELDFFLNCNVSEQRQIILLAICKAHLFIFDFIAEIVRNCFYNQCEKISSATFNEFYNEKKYEHPEIDAVTENTVNKMRQVIFRILEQTEIIETAESGVLRRPYLSESLERLIVEDDPKWLSIYLYSNNEISNLKELYA